MTNPFISIAPNGDGNGGYNTQVGGQISRYLTQDDKNLFSINIDSLKNGVKKIFNKEPNDVYLQDPTHWGDKAGIRLGTGVKSSCI